MTDNSVSCPKGCAPRVLLCLVRLYERYCQRSSLEYVGRSVDVLFCDGGYCRDALVLPMAAVFIACRWVYCSGCHAATLE